MSGIYSELGRLTDYEKPTFCSGFLKYCKFIQLVRAQFEKNIHKINLHIRTDRNNSIFLKFLLSFHVLKNENHNKRNIF